MPYPAGMGDTPEGIVFTVTLKYAFDLVTAKQ